MTMARVALSFLVVILFVVEARCLKPGGQNVLTKNETYYVTVLTTMKALTYRKTCKKSCYWFICSTTCKKVAFYKLVPTNKRVQKTRPVYECKQGWKENGDECTTGESCEKIHAPVNGEMNCTGNTTDHVCYFKCLPGYELMGSASRKCSVKNVWTSVETSCKPICVGGCKNNGTCIAPNTCKCPRGWAGDQCHLGESCEKIHAPVNGEMNCTGNTTDHVCYFKCLPGYELMGSASRNCSVKNVWTSVETSCKPICVGGCKNNGTCIAPNTCKCPRGWAGDQCHLGELCDKIHPPVNGEMNCTGNTTDHVCYFKCFLGYELMGSASRNCSVKNVWASVETSCKPICVGGCKHNGICIAPNTCKCPRGWAGDQCHLGELCEKIYPPANGEMNCTGNTTDHVCYFKCLPGYELMGSASRKCSVKNVWTSVETSCKPICVGGCKHNGTCIAPNTCKCPRGWAGDQCHLGELCEKIHPPANGEMNCTGNTTDHVCYFKCLPGYELMGSASRKCSVKNVWTSVETSCKRIYCPDAVPPANGFVYHPCNTEFASECIVGCAYGYFIKGTNKIACGTSGVWEPRNVLCKAITSCQPNPCKNGGECSPVSSSRYSCDCSRTGYKGSDCEIGYIATPTYPTLTPGIPSTPLQFRSSPASDHVILVLQCRGIDFNPPVLTFNATSTRQSVTITAKQSGLYFVEYLLTGADAIDFKSPEKDVIFVDDAPNSKNKTSGNSSSLYRSKLPVGCHRVKINKCPRSSDVIVFSSTSSWKPSGAVTSTKGVVTLGVGKTVLPLSLLGTSIERKNSPSIECDASRSNYSSEVQLIRSRVVTRSFLEALQSSLPKWLAIGLPRRNKSKSFSKSDIETYFYSDMELQQIDVGKGQPLMQNSYFSLLLSRNINLTVEQDSDILAPDKPQFAMAVDLCSPTPKNIILRPSTEDADKVNNISVFKRLKSNGWDLTIHSLQISPTQSIEKLKKGVYWNGKGFIRIDSSTKGNLALVSSLRKSFIQSLGNFHVRFDGTMVMSVVNLDKILHSPLDQKWSVDLYGNTKLTMELQVEGKKTNVTLNTPQSIGHATFGGSLHESSSVERTPAEGLYLSHIFKDCPFQQSALGDFVELGTNQALSVVLRTKLQPDKTSDRSENGDNISGISMAFPGHLKFGPVLFEDMDVRLWTQSPRSSSLFPGEPQSGIEVKGDYRDDVPRKLGIFQTTPLHPRMYISRGQNGSSWGSFQSVVKILGFEKQVNVTFSRDGLNFDASGKVHGLYDAHMRCHSRLASWENQRITAIGEFEDKPGGLMEDLNNAIYRYGIRVLNRATKRVMAFKQREERAKTRLRNIIVFTETKIREMKKAEEEHMAAERKLKGVELDFKNLESNVSGRLARLRLQLGKLCRAMPCRDVCREGVVCRKCDYEVAGKSKETCLGSCYKTERRRVAFSRSVLRETHDCAMTYLKSGLSMGGLEDTLALIKKQLFSYGMKTSYLPSKEYPSKEYSAMRDARSHFSPGNTNEDVCLRKSFPRNSDSLVLSNPFEDFVTTGSHGRKTCRKDRRHGYWDCRVRLEKFKEMKSEDENYQKRYACERPCEVHVTSEHIPKSCCATVPCAFSIVNVTCVAQNVLCSKIRSDALKKVVLSKDGSSEVLEKLEIARSNVSYWKIMKRKAVVRLSSASRSVNISQKAVINLRKAYNITVQSKENISKILSGPLRLDELLRDSLKPVVKFDVVKFNVMTAEDGPTLLPVQLVFTMNGTQQRLPAVLDFKNLNSSLKSIAKDILDVYMHGRPVHDEVRNKRSTGDTGNSASAETSNNTVHHAISSLQKYHKLCSEFTNYERVLHDIVLSLYNLTSEMNQLLTNNVEMRNMSKKFNASSVLESFRINHTIAAGFGLATTKSEYLSHLDTDHVVGAALGLETEAIKDGFLPLHLTAELVFRNWYSAMERIFDVVLRECSGFDDCVTYVMDGFSEMHEDIDFPEAGRVQRQITDVRTKLFELIQSLDLSTEETAKASSSILRILKDVMEVKFFCARSPNITKHPELFTELGVARTLTLTCNATGYALVYKWKFNDDLLEDQTTNVLLIRNTTVSNSGNYTCEVSNHISQETSTPALVVIRTPPSITVQPVNRLSVDLFGSDSLRCSASSDDIVVYQWLFRSLNSTSFVPLPNETFPYLNFSPMKANHEGWYFCNVSNSYGFSISKTSFVTALRFTLPMPVAELSLSVTSRPIGNATVVHRRSRSITQGNARVYSQMLDLLSRASGHTSNATNPQIKRLHVVVCEPIKSSKSGTAESCRWKFDYVGENTTAVNMSEAFQVSARKVVNSARVVQRAADRLFTATNNGMLSFAVGNQKYVLEPHTFTVGKFSMMCAPGQQSIQQGFRCVDCPPGYYGELDAVGVATCLRCPFGSYQTKSGQTSCLKCPEGFTTANQGSYDKSRCKEPTVRHTTTKKTSEATEPRSTEPRSTEPRITEPRSTEPRIEPTARAVSSDKTSHAPLIGGVVGGFVLLVGLLLLLFLFLRRKRRNTKDNDPTDLKDIVDSSSAIELSNWGDNPAYLDDSNILGHGSEAENPIYESNGVPSPPSNNGMALGNPLYAPNPYCNIGPLDKKTPSEESTADDSSDAAPKLYNSYDNYAVENDIVNPLYEALPEENQWKEVKLSDESVA